MHIVFTGGGTAGHINPALAVAGHLAANDKDVKISYIGKKGGLEERLVAAAGYDFYPISVAGFRRSLSPFAIIHNISALFKAITASFKAKRLLKKLSPDIVMGTGGYVSGPVVRAAAKLGIKTVIHEQNAFPGVTTKMLVPLVDKVMLAMPEAQPRLELRDEPVITGNPVRGELKKRKRHTARIRLGLGDKPMILSFGGSLGAEPINRAMESLMEENAKTGKYSIIHAAGKADYETMKKRLEHKGVKPDISCNRLLEYIDDMATYMAAADLVVCRAGAITLSEIQCCGKASILIPSPYVAENHQYHNAMSLKNREAAEVLEEKNLSAKALSDLIDSIMNDPGRLNKMQKNAKQSAIADSCERIAEVIYSVLKK